MLTIEEIKTLCIDHDEIKDVVWMYNYGLKTNATRFVIRFIDHKNQCRSQTFNNVGLPIKDTTTKRKQRNSQEDDFDDDFFYYI